MSSGSSINSSSLPSNQRTFEESNSTRIAISNWSNLSQSPSYGSEVLNSQISNNSEIVNNNLENKNESENNTSNPESILLENAKEMSSKYPYNNYGLFGEKGDNCRVIKTPDPVATSKDFFKKISKGGTTEPFEKGNITNFNKKIFITHRIITSTKDSPAVSINAPKSSFIKKQKIHFIKKE